jgi:uncharacterized protein YfaP (DUF2135 family)
MMGVLGLGCGDDGGNSTDSGVEFQPWTLEALTPEQGFTVLTPQFEVAAGEEVQICYFMRTPDLNGDGSPFWIDRTLTAINPGSHHMNVFRVKTIVSLDPEDGAPVQMGEYDGTVISNGECFNSAAWADWPLLANSQKSNTDDPYTDWILPEGVATQYVPGEWLLVQAHYVNATTQQTLFAGRVGINFYRTQVENPQELGTLFATQQSLRICQSSPTPKYAGTCNLPAGTNINVTAANGHFHSRGTRFRIFSWDGQSETEPPAEDMFYESLEWDDPPMTTDLDLIVPDGGGVWWTCEYQWYEPPIGCDAVNAVDPQGANDCCYTFGGRVETNEHCNVFLYYWPRGETDVFCN